MTASTGFPASPDAQEPRNQAPKPDHTTPKRSAPQNRVPRSTLTYGCGGCDNHWTGISRCHCSRCHLTFSGIGLFDAHQRGGQCIDPAEMDVKGDPLRLLNGVWSGPELPAEALAKMRGGQ